MVPSAAPQHSAIASCVAVIALAFASSLPAHADSIAPLLKTIAAPRAGAQSGVFFGSSVAASPTYAVVGEPGGQGFVKIFDASTGELWLTLSSPGGEANRFGTCVAIEGSRLAVGAPEARTDTTPNAGRIYVYDLGGDQPETPVLTLSSPTPRSEEAFGSALSLSGDRLIAGVPRTNQGGKIESGQVYVYDLAAANAQSPILTLVNPTPADADFFGAAVAISGQRVVVGAPGDDTGAKDAGRAYVYDLNRVTPTTPVWTLAPPVLQASLNFGQAISLSGSTLVIGVSGETVSAAPLSGRVYVYELTGARPSTASTILQSPAPANGERFGLAVAVADRRVLAGTANGTFFAFHLDEGTEGTAVDLPDAVPDSPLSLALSGSLALIGNPESSSIMPLAGSAYLGDLATDVILQELSSPTPRGDDRFASAVAWSGSSLIVGAPAYAGDVPEASDVGQVYVYETTSDSESAIANPTPANGDAFGATVAAASNWILISAPGDTEEGTGGGSGVVYVFNLSLGSPSFIIENPDSTGHSFGSVVAASGNLAVIGAKGGGKAYVYDLDSGSPDTPVATLENPSARPGSFPWAIALSSQLVAISDADFQTPLEAPDPDPQTENQDDGGGEPPPPPANNVFGAIYTYDLSILSGAISPKATILNPVAPGATISYIGDQLALDGTKLAVSGLLYAQGEKPERVYLYELGGETPATPLRTFTPPVAQPVDGFGTALAFIGDQLAVGAPYSGQRLPMDPPFENTLIPGAGQVHLFDLDPETLGYLGTINPPEAPSEPRAASGFGFGTALASDGTQFAVGAPSGGTQYQKRFAFVFGSGSRRPSILAPAAGSLNRAPIAFTLALRQIPQAGSVRLLIGDSEYPLSAAYEVPGTLQLTLNPSNPASHPAILSGPPIPNGTYDLMLRYLDRTGTEVTSPLVEGVTVDTVPPSIIPPPAIGMVANRPNGAMVDYPAATVTDESGVASVTYSTRSGTFFPFGMTPVTITATDLAGNESTASFQVSVLAFQTVAPRSRAVVRSSTRPLTISGTANNLVTEVLVSVNGGNPISAIVTATAKGKRWTISIPPSDLVPWSNSIEVTAIAGDANVTSPPQTFFYEVLSPLTVEIDPPRSGSLTFSPRLGRGNMAALGRPYEVTASPRPGFVFDFWEGLPAPQPYAASFVHEDGGLVKATFVPTPFTKESGGSYNGTLLSGATPDQQNCGLFTAQVTNTSAAFSARLILDGVTTSFRGWFYHEDGRYQSPIPRDGLSLSLVLETSDDGTNRISGMATRWDDGAEAFVTPIDAPQCYSASAPVPAELIAAYNCALSVSDSSTPTTGLPDGEGTATLTISKSGSVKLTGVLADNNAFTSASLLTRTGMAPIYAPFPKRSGLLAGDLTVDLTQAATDVTSGEIRWFQLPHQRRQYYPNGFYTNLDLIGAKQQSSSPAALQLSSEPSLEFTGGPFADPLNPDPIHVDLVRVGNNRFASADRSTTITLTAKGHFSGTHIPSPQEGRYPFRGVIVAKDASVQTLGTILTPAPKKANGNGLSGSVRLFSE